jgi:hypothetical protein
MVRHFQNSFMKYITDTGYPVSLAKVAVEYRDVIRIVEACGSNLDASDFIISGGLFRGNLLKESMPAIAHHRETVSQPQSARSKS